MTEHSSPPVRLAEQTIAVGSGKGGVGKSTVCVNLAVALAQSGLTVGIIDADVYGPSIPVMLGLRRLSPKANADGKKALPFCKFGVQAMSIGFFVEEARSVIWRGPILHGTLNRLLHEVEWGALDVLLIDLPPGTGDVPLSLSQLLVIDGAVAVTTPQEVAMLDAIKAVNALTQLEIPLLGVVENMAGFTPPDSNTVHYIFGQGKGQELADRFETTLLGQIPLIPDIRIGGDEGRPAALLTSTAAGAAFERLGHKVREALTQRTANPFV